MSKINREESKNLKIALVGFGNWGKNWARTLNSIGVLGFICDSSQQRLAEARQIYPQVEFFTEFHQILTREDISALIIASPVITHYSFVKEALQSGKDVLVEKPLALSVGQGQELVQLAEKNSRILMVGHVLEYHPAVQKLLKLVQEGDLGKVQYIYSNRLNIGRIRTEENALWSFAPHDIAIILRLLDQNPREVNCRGDAYVNREVADVTLTSLSFVNQVRAHIFVSWLHPFKEHRLVVIGDKKMAVFDDTKDWSAKLIEYPHRIEWLKGVVPTVDIAEGMSIPLQKKEPLLAEAEDFINSIHTRRKPLTDGKSALKVLEVLERAQESLVKQNSHEIAGVDNYQNSLSINDIDSENIHPTAIVDSQVKIGLNTRVWHFCHLKSGATIGSDCVLGQNVYVGGQACIGDHVKIQNNVSVYDGVVLENNVFCGPSVVFTNVKTPRSEISRRHEFQQTLIKEGASLGANSTILCGVTIGRYVLVGAGAVVSKDIPDYAIAVGVPAQIQGWACECGLKLNFEKEESSCSCGRNYKKANSNVQKLVYENTSV